MEEIKERKNLEKRDGRPPRRVFLEVGTNIIPVPVMGEKTFEDDVYLGIDVRHEKSLSAKENTEVLKRGNNIAENISFVAADAKHLPLIDESVDELYFGNVFGDPSIPPAELVIFLEEAGRALKRSGILTIKETNTPAEPDNLRQMLSEHGFTVESFVKFGSKEWPAVAAPYDRVTNVKEILWFPNSYLIKARKSD